MFNPGWDGLGSSSRRGHLFLTAQHCAYLTDRIFPAFNWIEDVCLDQESMTGEGLKLSHLASWHTPMATKCLLAVLDLDLQSSVVVNWFKLMPRDSALSCSEGGVCDSAGGS